MAAIGSSVTTLLDVAKMTDPDGKAAAVAELLSQSNEVLLDMDWKEGNLPTGHRTTVRTGLPTVAWRLLNQGVSGSKSTTAQIDEQCGMLEAWSEVDKDLAELNGNTQAFRLQEAAAFVEAMNQEFVQTLFYGNTSASPEEFTGLSIRYSATSAANGQNIIKAGGAGSDNSSMWLICWGANTLHGIYPKGSKAGLIHENLGLVTTQDATGIGGAKLRVYQDHWQWKCGIALRDWRFAVRICNIDISNLVAKSSAADLVDKMIMAMHRIPSLGMGKCAFYANRTVKQMLDIQRRDDVAAAGMTYADVDGKPVMSFRGVPVRTVDQLLETESAVS
jgi:hypothetical protein